MSSSTQRSIDPQELYTLWKSHRPVELIDVRPSVVFEEGHAEPARSVPFETLDPEAFLTSHQDANGEPLYVICQVGKRSAEACRRLAEAGLLNVVNVEGGTQAWRASGLPIVGNTKRFPLARQVQVVAGSLALVGAILGYFLHALFIAVPAVIGGGLLVTGLTGTCFMGLLLARMPWNRRSESFAARPIERSGSR